jgi:hypothetical protein
MWVCIGAVLRMVHPQVLFMACQRRELPSVVPCRATPDHGLCTLACTDLTL